MLLQNTDRTRHLMFLLKSKQLQSDYHRSNHLIRSKLPARLNDRLETFSHAISLFWHKVFINIGPDLLDFAFECGNRPRFASLELGLHVSPYLFNGIQIWRVGGPLSMRAGFDVVWYVFFKPSICCPCFVSGRAIMNKCPATIAGAKYLVEIRFHFGQNVKVLGPRHVIVIDE